jgi:hypothetical protein
MPFGNLIKDLNRAGKDIYTAETVSLGGYIEGFPVSEPVKNKPLNVVVLEKAVTERMEGFSVIHVNIIAVGCKKHPSLAVRGNANDFFQILRPGREHEFVSGFTVKSFAAGTYPHDSPGILYHGINPGIEYFRAETVESGGADIVPAYTGICSYIDISFLVFGEGTHKVRIYAKLLFTIIGQGSAVITAEAHVCPYPDIAPAIFENGSYTVVAKAGAGPCEM